MTTQAWLWTANGAAVLVALAAGVADRRRVRRRRNIDSVGWAPWRGIHVAAWFAAIALLLINLHD